MAGSRALQNRIRSTKNIRQMTRAMEAVSAVKMRKSQLSALSARPYALTALSILHKIQKSTGEAFIHPLTEKRNVSNICVVAITSDKGLAGSFNTNVIRKVEKLIEHSGKQTSLVTIGKKGRDYFRRTGSILTQEFLGAGDFGAIEETRPISNFLIDLFTKKECDEVILVYTNFISALKQEIVVRKILPFSEDALQEIIDSITPLKGRYANMPDTLVNIHNESETLLFEPSAHEALSQILPELLAVQLFHAILEANASEHSSRMLAMKNASESAGDLVDRLNIQYNKARQAAITKELSEISAGREALEA